MANKWKFKLASNSVDNPKKNKIDIFYLKEKIKLILLCSRLSELELVDQLWSWSFVV